MNYKNIIVEDGFSAVFSKPKKVREINNDNIRMECVLQTVNDVNRNKRLYTKEVLEEGLKKIKDKLKEGSLLGELDHPTDRNPSRQFTVLYKESSHRIREVGWEGNRLIGIVETLSTPNGKILKALVEDKVPIGFSFRGVGDVQPITEGGRKYNKVVGPIHIVTWDAVSYPSHKEAKMIRITEGDVLKVHKKMGQKVLMEGFDFQECDGLICTRDGVCYLPDVFELFYNKRRRF